MEGKLVDGLTKECPTCKQTKSLEEGFHKNKAAPNGYQWHCIECRKKIDSRPEKRKQDRDRYHANNQKSYRNSTLKRFYGITLKEYELMLNEQAGVCAICKNICSSGRRLAVDHNHQTGKVRGLLCACCNSGIAHFREDENLFYSGLAYLRKHS